MMQMIKVIMNQMKDTVLLKETERGRKEGERRTKKGRREEGGGEEKREGERLRDQLIDLGDLRALERGRKEHTQPG